MIARTPTVVQPFTWQQELAGGFRSPAELLAAVDLTPLQIDVDLDAERNFPLRVPHAYVRRMRRGDPGDPLLLQVLPLRRERDTAPGFSTDPVGDRLAMRGPGVLHKYRGRALLITTGACAIHCRYCFRRHFPYADAHAAEDDWQPALDTIAGDATISEIILSGGDPLALSTPRLASLIDSLATIPHLRRLRIHTRLPIVLPARVEDSLLGLLAGTRLQPAMVVHANHPAEIDDEVHAVLTRLVEAGITVLNQSVLLRGINDDAAILGALSERLFAARVLPYYLHQLDRVSGAAHFEVSDTRALEILTALRNTLPGYLVPRLVREIEGHPAKHPLGSDHANLL